jgi:hypothetical protein
MFEGDGVDHDDFSVGHVKYSVLAEVMQYGGCGFARRADETRDFLVGDANGAAVVSWRAVVEP